MTNKTFVLTFVGLRLTIRHFYIIIKSKKQQKKGVFYWEK